MHARIEAGLTLLEIMEHFTEIKEPDNEPKHEAYSHAPHIDWSAALLQISQLLLGNVKLTVDSPHRF